MLSMDDKGGRRVRQMLTLAAQYCGRSRPVGAQWSMGLGRNPLINGLVQHTF